MTTTDVERAGRIQTVTGLIDPARLGITHVHEHIIFDQSDAYYEPHPDFPEIGEQEVTLENRWIVEHNPFNNRDNLRFVDVDLAASEVQRFKDAGGGTLLEMSSIGMNGDAAALREVSERTGVAIVKGAGWYTRQAHGQDLGAATVDELAAAMIGELLDGDGVGDSAVKAGVIGEVGLSAPIHPDERKVLEAAIVAQQHTGVAMVIHPGMGDETLMEILQILRSHGARPERVIIGHLDCFGFSLDAQDRVADEGYFMAWDNFGATHFMPTPRLSKPLLHPSDGERLRTLEHFVERGNVDQITVAQDLSCKHDLARYGGSGYSHIIRNILPMMRTLGFTEKAIDAITVENPKRALTIEG